MKTIRSLLAASALAVLCSNVANADTSTQTYTLGTTPLVLAGPVSEGDASIPETVIAFPFEQFDTSLGTLDSVDWEYNLNFALEGTAGPAGGVVGGGISALVYLDPLRDAGLGDISGKGNGNGGFSPQGPINLPINLVDSKSGWTTLAIGPSFDFFSAAGGGMHQFEVVLLAGDSDDPSIEADAGVFDATLSLIEASSTLTFHFTPTEVPEPTSLALLGLGAAGMMVLRRRRAGN